MSSYREVALQLMEWIHIVCQPSDGVEVLPLWCMDTARINDKRPAYVQAVVPDEWVKNLTGTDEQDVYLLVKVPHEIHETWVNLQSQPEVIKTAMKIKESSGTHIETSREGSRVE